MKQVFEQYASAIIAVLLASLLFTVMWSGAFFQGKGIPQVLGQILEYSIGEQFITENGTFEEYMNEAAPAIIECNAYVVANQPVLLSDCYEAKSYQGTVLPVFLKRIWDTDGTEVDVGVSEDRETICMSEAGIYWVQVYTIDENGKQSSKIAKLLVNER